MSIRKMRVKLLRLVFIPIILATFLFSASWPEASRRRFVTEWVGYALLMSGLALRMWSVLYIGQRKSKELVTTGPYSICRNPLYSGTLLVVVGAAGCLENPVMGLVTLVLMVPLYIAVTLQEERHLEQLFGQEFLDYKRRVPRFLFAFRQYRSPDAIDVPVRALRRATVETAGVLLVLPLADLIEVLHARHVLPIIWRFP